MVIVLNRRIRDVLTEMTFGQRLEGDEAARREELWVEDTSADLSLPDVSSVHFTLINPLS